MIPDIAPIKVLPVSAPIIKIKLMLGLVITPSKLLMVAIPTKDNIEPNITPIIPPKRPNTPDSMKNNLKIC